MENTDIFMLQTFLIGILSGLGAWFIFQTLETRLALLLTGAVTVSVVNILHGFVRDEKTIKSTRR